MAGPSTDEVLAELRRRGLRMTPQRRAIVSEAMAAAGHISASALARKIEERVPGCNPSTVYRTLALLEEVGVLSHTHLEQGVEYHRAEEAGHVHLKCSRCGRTENLSAREAEPLRDLLHDRHGFLADLTHFEIAGLCRRCQRSRARASRARPHAAPSNRSPRTRA